MGKIDIICGLITGAFSLLFYIGTLSFPEISIGINPRAYPMVIIVAAFGLSVLLVLQGAVKMRRDKAKTLAETLAHAAPKVSAAPEASVASKTLGASKASAAGAKTLPRGKTAWYLVILAAAMLVYALSMEDLGYVIVTPPLAALAMWLFGERKPLKIILVSVLISIILYWIFRSAFRVPLPRSFIW